MRDFNARALWIVELSVHGLCSEHRRFLIAVQVWWQPQLIAAAALPSSNQNILRRLFADDVLVSH